MHVVLSKYKKKKITLIKYKTVNKDNAGNNSNKKRFVAIMKVMQY